MANNTGRKYGGRKKSLSNKGSVELREAFTELLQCNIGKVQELFDKVAEKNPQKALEILLKLSEFAVPKMRAVEINADVATAHTNLDIRIIDTGVPFASCEGDVIE